VVLGARVVLRGPVDISYSSVGKSISISKDTLSACWQLSNALDSSPLRPGLQFQTLLS